MKLSDIELPSNKKFGLFFTLVFILSAVFFYTKEIVLWTYIMSLASVVFLFFSILKADLLLPLNKLWMRFGLLLAIIVRPIVLGAILFGLFTPIAFLMRLSGRDELMLKFRKKPSHWIVRKELIKSENFRRQF